MEFKQANAAVPRLGTIAFEPARGCIAQIDIMHMTNERVLMVMPAEQREIAASLGQGIHLAHILVRAADRLAEPRAGAADLMVEHIATPGVRARAFHGVRRPCGHFLQTIVEFLRRNVLEGDGRHGLAVAIALAQLGLDGPQPFDGLGGGGAVPVGVGQVESSRIDHIRRVLGVVFFGFAGIIA